VRNIFSAASFKFGDMLKPLIATPILISSFGLDGFGTYALALSLIAICYPIIDGGLLSFSQRSFYHKGIEGEEVSRGVDVIKVQLYFFPVILLIFTILFLFILDSLSEAFSCALYLFFFSVSISINGYFRALDRVLELAKLKILFDILEVLCVVVYAALASDFSLDIFIYLSLVKFLYFISQFIYLFGSVQKAFTEDICWRNIRYFYRVSYAIVPVAVLGGMAGNAERFILEDYLGAMALGTYVVLMQFVFLLKLLVFPITFIKLPDLSRMFDEHGAKALYRQLRTFINITLCITITSSALFWLLKWVIYEWWLGVELNSEATQTIFLLLLTVVCMNVNSILLLGYTVTGRLGIFTVLNAVMLVLTIALNVQFVEEYGYVASALILFSLNFVLVIVSYLRFRSLIRAYV
jgi:O-antigen/teichoic acid export membrane protein